jgi:hypothetical protein
MPGVDSLRLGYHCAGMLVGLSSRHCCMAAGIACLRNINPYVATALHDWQQRSGTSPSLPRQTAAAPSRREPIAGSARQTKGPQAFLPGDAKL